MILISIVCKYSNLPSKKLPIKINAVVSQIKTVINTRAYNAPFVQKVKFNTGKKITTYSRAPKFKINNTGLTGIIQMSNSKPFS